MHNQHIESLVFEAKTLDGQMPIHLRFHEITEVNTVENLFYFKDGLHEPVACQYDTLHLLEPDEVIDARLKAAQTIQNVLCATMQDKYHITFGGKRTTISVDTILSQMMAIKLGEVPDTLEAHGAVREWLQTTLTTHLGEDEIRKDASQWARRYLIETLVDKILSKQWEDWWLDET